VKNDVFCLLEAQRLEHLLVDAINSAAVPSISTRFHSQLLMTQRLHRAELEAKLYRCAIAKGGLPLLEGIQNYVVDSPPGFTNTTYR
jgi:hypothetical protein